MRCNTEMIRVTTEQIPTVTFAAADSGDGDDGGAAPAVYGYSSGAQPTASTPSAAATETAAPLRVKQIGTVQPQVMGQSAAAPAMMAPPPAKPPAGSAQRMRMRIIAPFTAIDMQS